MKQRLGPRRTKELVDKATELRRSGLPWSAIAIKLHVSKDWLNYNTGKAGMERYDRTLMKTSEANVIKAIELRAQGVCWKLVERQIGVLASTLQWALRVRKESEAEYPASVNNGSQ